MISTYTVKYSDGSARSFAFTVTGNCYDEALVKAIKDLSRFGYDIQFSIKEDGYYDRPYWFCLDGKTGAVFRLRQIYMHRLFFATEVGLQQAKEECRHMLKWWCFDLGQVSEDRDRYPGFVDLCFYSQDALTDGQKYLVLNVLCPDSSAFDLESYERGQKLMLKLLEQSQQCSIQGCENQTLWTWNDTPICADEMRAMSFMNSDNEWAFHRALFIESLPLDLQESFQEAYRTLLDCCQRDGAIILSWSLEEGYLVTDQGVNSTWVFEYMWPDGPNWQRGRYLLEESRRKGTK